MSKTNHMCAIPGFPDYWLYSNAVYSTKKSIDPHPLASFEGYQHDRVYQLHANGKKHYRHVDELVDLVNRAEHGASKQTIYYVSAVHNGVPKFLDNPPTFASFEVAEKHMNDAADRAPGTTFIVVEVVAKVARPSILHSDQLNINQCILQLATVMGVSDSDIATQCDNIGIELKYDLGIWTASCAGKHRRQHSATSALRRLAILRLLVIVLIGKQVSAI